MNAVDRLISFIELAMTTGNDNRFNIMEDEGYPLILDNSNKIRIAVGVEEIRVTRYSLTTNAATDDIYVPWDTLSIAQKDRLMRILDTGEELDPEIAETLEDILKGAF